MAKSPQDIANEAKVAREASEASLQAAKDRLAAEKNASAEAALQAEQAAEKSMKRFNSIKDAWSSLSGVTQSDQIEAAVKTITLEDKALGNWYARYAGKAKSSLGFNGEKFEGAIGGRLSVLESFTETSKEIQQTLERIGNKSTGSGERATLAQSPALAKQARKLEIDFQKGVTEHLTALQGLENAAEKMSGELTKIYNQELKNITGGSTKFDAEMQKKVELFNEKFSAFSDKVLSQYTSKIDLHKGAIDEARSMLAGLEAGGVKLNVKLSLDELKAGESLVKSAEKTEASAAHGAESAAGHGGGGKMMPALMTAAGVGLALHGLSDDENKFNLRTIGGIALTAVGLGGLMRGPKAAAVLTQLPNTVAHAAHI